MKQNRAAANYAAAHPPPHPTRRQRARGGPGWQVVLSAAAIACGGSGLTHSLPRTVLTLFFLFFTANVVGQRAPDVVLRGSLTRSDNQTYKLLPFTVPAGVERITFDLTYTGRDQKTVVDLGLMDPEGFRGWSGGRASEFTVSATDATPSYLPGRIVPGTWKLILGIPNIRPNVTATYVANIYFSRGGEVRDAGAIYPTLRNERRWYRGDLHMHTGHSDGSCRSQAGKSVACPVFFTVDAAAKRGLDFIAITDHNTISQYDAMRELQSYFDRVLLIPGREITTFQGHANVFGTTAFIDFRVGSQAVPTWNDVLRQVKTAGGMISINHPNDVSGESCMGCGWHPEPPPDMNLVAAVEAVNGTAAEGPSSGIPFWEGQLRKGYRLTGIAGSDNHNGTLPLPGPGSIGYPTTVVLADELSIPAILGAIRAGHVFIDVTGSSDRLLEMSARAGDAMVNMGDMLVVPSSSVAIATVHVKQANGGRIEIIEDGGPSAKIPPANVTQDDQSFAFQWQSDGLRHWMRANVRDAQGKLILVGNPIYINYDRSTSATAAVR